MRRLGSLLQLDWQNTLEGAETTRSVLTGETFRRKQFGLLERPSLPSNLQESSNSYKIYVCGKSGIGKTSTVARLSGLLVPQGYCETLGLYTSVVHWPVKISATGKVMVFHLEFWDAGDYAAKKYDYISPSCQEDADAVMFVFSFTDKSSFDEIPEQMSRVLMPLERPQTIVVGTRYDMHAKLEVGSREVWEFEQRWKMPVIKMKNVAVDVDNEALQKLEFHEVSFILNVIAEQLWYHGQTSMGIYLPEAEDSSGTR